jgi:hypothetical protein
MRLTLKVHLWVMVVQSKRAANSIEYIFAKSLLATLNELCAL